jgi:hypothetical protein
MSLELFLEDIELSDNIENDNTFDVLYDPDTKLIHAIENNANEPRTFIYRLLDDQDTIAKNHREEILDYCLAVVLKTDEVGLGDIFIHGKYVEKIS